MAQNTTQNYLRYVKGVMITVDLKMKEAKEMSLKKEWYWNGQFNKKVQMRSMFGEGIR